MSIEVQIDSKDVERVTRHLQQLPAQIRSRVIARAMKRVASQANTAIVRDIASLTDLQQKHVRSRVATLYNSGAMTMDTKVLSSFIPLIEIGGRRMQKILGMSAKKHARMLAKAGQQTRGSFRTAFIASVKHGPAVFRREGSGRGPLDELFGPNPAHAVEADPERYSNVLNGIINQYLLPRLVHEITQAMS